ncbi:hypothetical protein LguiA_025007 [Lonicera macranthoides]
MNPRVPEVAVKPELENLINTYGKFWCTWQLDRGDRLPMGAPALMMSPRGVNLGMVKPEFIQRRDIKYNTPIDALRAARLDVPEPRLINPQANYWIQHGKARARQLTHSRTCCPMDL